MQVLLKDNVPQLGRRGQIVTVKPGYARNYLLPKGMAVAVTTGTVQAIEQEQKRLQKIADQERMESQALADRINGYVINVTAKANEEGVLFGSVGPVEIAEKLTAEVAPVDVSMVRMDEHIKQVGEHEVTIRVAQDVEATCTVNVAAEAEPQPQPEA